LKIILQVTYFNNCDNNISLENKLKNLISKNHVSHNFVNELLVILRTEGLNKLPKDSRSLLRTPKMYDIISIETRIIYYIGFIFI